VITTAAVVVTLPNLRGVDYPAAEDTLIALGLVPTRVDEISNELPAGQVLRTNPEPGPVAVGTNVTVVVSAGPPPPPPSPSEAATPSPT
jgi:serine/threonine-protein kinase